MGIYPMRSTLVLAMLVSAASPAQTVNSAVPPKAAPAATTRSRITSTAQRNENVAVYAIDNNAVKEANIRVGTRATVSQFTSLEGTHFATEHGQAPSEALLVRSEERRV